ncbi:MAG TPA: hypothetical protein VF271_08800 [Rhodanobacteraceae bacterium]
MTTDANTDWHVAEMAAMRAAIAKAVAVGPDFLAGRVAPEHMAHTMIDAVQGFVHEAQAQGWSQPSGREAQELGQALSELMGCGSGFLAQRCDAACVARTMTCMVDTYGKAPANPAASD